VKYGLAAPKFFEHGKQLRVGAREDTVVRHEAIVRSQERAAVSQKRTTGSGSEARKALILLERDIGIRIALASWASCADIS
jgi:hypothetical protein